MTVTPEDRAALVAFLAELQALVDKYRIAPGICPDCDELKLFLLVPGARALYVFDGADHLLVGIEEPAEKETT
jgi:hypothetical protein